MAASSLILIGASAGGIPAVIRLIEQLPGSLPAAVLVVQHLAPGIDGGSLAARLDRHTPLSCHLAQGGEAVENGHLYLAPPDQHLLVEGSHLTVTFGARENRFRPAVDALFRSAAVEWGRKTTGVILTGMLHDGTTGMECIRRCGGHSVVQDPNDAEYPSMPASAMKAGADYVIPVSKMGSLLLKLATRMSMETDANGNIPEDLRREAAIARRVLAGADDVAPLGSPAQISCPDCGGGLWEMAHGEVLRYRCHTGHAFSGDYLLELGQRNLEESLWVALRIMEEQRLLLSRLASRGEAYYGTSQEERLEEIKKHIHRLRAYLAGEPDPVAGQ